VLSPELILKMECPTTTSYNGTQVVENVNQYKYDNCKFITDKFLTLPMTCPIVYTISDQLNVDNDISSELTISWDDRWEFNTTQVAPTTPLAFGVANYYTFYLKSTIVVNSLEERI